jgi:hypothetical protein
MIVILTTTYYDLYQRDLLNVTCKNEGDRIGFSYDTKYIEKKNPEAPDPELVIKKGDQALIIYAEYDKQNRVYKRYHPVRYCTIEQVIRHDDSATTDVHLLLGGYFLYADGSNTLIVDNWNKVILEDIKTKEKGKLKNFIRDLDITGLSPNQGVQKNEAWPNLVKYLGTLTDLTKCVFFQQVNPKTSTDLKVKDLANPTPFKWKSDTLYEIEFLVRGGDGLKDKAAFPGVSTNSNIICQGPFISQTGNATRVRYVLATVETLKKKISPLIIKSIDTERPGVSISPEISNFVEIRAKRWLLWLSFIILFVSISFPQLAEIFFSKEGNYCFLNFCRKGEQWIKYIKFGSVILLAIGSFIVYRKFPKGGD